MKLFILTSLILVSFNAFSADEVGENQKGECEFANQSSKREAKLVVKTDSVETKKEVPAETISK